MLLQMKINGRIQIKVFYLFGTQNILDFDFLISQLDIDFFFFLMIFDEHISSSIQKRQHRPRLSYLLPWLTILSIPPRSRRPHPETEKPISSSASPPSSWRSRQRTQTSGRLEPVGQRRPSPFRSWHHPTVPHPDAERRFSSLLLVRWSPCSGFCRAGSGSAQEEAAAICTWLRSKCRDEVLVGRKPSRASAKF